MLMGVFSFLLSFFAVLVLGPFILVSWLFGLIWRLIKTIIKGIDSAWNRKQEEKYYNSYYNNGYYHDDRYHN